MQEKWALLTLTREGMGAPVTISWIDIQALEGQTVSTVTGVPLGVERVEERAVIVRLQNGEARRIPREEVEAAAQLGLQGNDLRPTTVRAAGASDFNPAYVVALLRAVVKPRS